MLVKIGFDPKSVLKVDLERGEIIVKVKHIVALHSACHIATVRGSTLDDYEKNNASRSMSLLINQRGTIIPDRH